MEEQCYFSPDRSVTISPKPKRGGWSKLRIGGTKTKKSGRTLAKLERGFSNYFARSTSNLIMLVTLTVHPTRHREALNVHLSSYGSFKTIFEFDWMLMWIDRAEVTPGRWESWLWTAPIKSSARRGWRHRSNGTGLAADVSLARSPCSSIF